MGDYNYLKPNASQKGSKGVVRKDDGMFKNMPAYPNFGGAYSKSLLHQDNDAVNLEKSPSARGGKPI
jgi:hypothetical protein